MSKVMLDGDSFSSELQSTIETTYSGELFLKFKDFPHLFFHINPTHQLRYFDHVNKIGI